MIDMPIRCHHPHGMRIDKAGGAVDDVDAVTLQLIGDHGDFSLDDLVFACHQVGKRQLLREFGAKLVQSSTSQSMNVLDRIFQGLTGEGPGIEGRAAQLRRFFNDGHALGQLRRLDGCFLAGWSAADDYHVVGLHRGF